MTATLHESLSTLIFVTIVGALAWGWQRNVRSAKRHLDILGTSLSVERVEALFLKTVARRRDAYDYTDRGLSVQPPSGTWMLSLDIEPEGYGCAGRLEPTSVVLEPFPRRFPVTRIVRNGEDIARRKRSFVRALRREDPQIELREARSIFGPH